MTNGEGLRFSLSTRIANGSEGILQTDGSELENINVEYDYTTIYEVSGFSFAYTKGFDNWDGQLSFGLGYQSLYDAKNDYEYKYEYDFDQMNISSQRKNDFSGGIRTLSPSVAVKLNRFISLGYSYNLTFNSTIKHLMENQYSQIIDGEYSYSVDEEESSAKTEGTFSTFCTIFDFHIIKLGLMYRSQMLYDLKERKIENKVDGETFIDHLHDFSKKIPEIYGASVALEPIKGLVLVGEYQNRAYSLLNNEEEYEYESFEDGHVRRFGLEIKPVDAVAIRAGAFREAVFVFEYDSGNPIEIDGFTGGLGITYNQLVVDIGLEYMSYEYDSLYFNPETWIDLGMMDGKMLELGISLGYRF